MLMSRELLVQCPDGQMKTVPLTGARLSIGRSSAAELCFPEDAGLSRSTSRSSRGRRLDGAGPGQQERHLRQQYSTESAADPQARRPRDRRAPGDRVRARCGQRPGVVVFEGETSSPTTSTVVTSLEARSPTRPCLRAGGSETSAPMQALIRAGQELSENRPLDELFP